MRWFNKNEMIRCYRERQQDRCRECRLQQAASRLPNGIEENIVALTEQVLDPAREKYGKPVVVNSGFRCPLHNKAVGGVYNSQHVSGQAADIAPAGFKVKDSGFKEELAKLARIIVENGKFDQLILYPTFVHVSWKRLGGNRQQILRKVDSGYEAVSRKEVLGVLMVIEWTSIAVALIGMVSGWVSWWLDRRRHRQEVEGLKADNRQKEMNLSKDYVSEFRTFIAEPLQREVGELRQEVKELKHAIELVSDCPHRDACPVRAELASPTR